MALVETAGAAWNGSAKSYSGISSVASASFTPTANGLLVLIVAVGNSNAQASTGFSITGTGFFSGKTWTPLVTQFAVAADGMAGIWVLDAGASPSAGVVTSAILGSTPPVGIASIIQQFAGANPAASQNGAKNSTTGTLQTIALTPGVTGSQIVSAYGSNNNAQTNTMNGSTTRYGVGTDTLNGSTFEAWKANALSSAGTPISTGFTTVAQPGSCMVAAEILPSGAAPSNILPQQMRHRAPAVFTRINTPMREAVYSR